jgi:hypothetical protein
VKTVLINKLHKRLNTSRGGGESSSKKAKSENTSENPTYQR